MPATFIGQERCIGVVCAHDADDDALMKDGRGAGGCGRCARGASRGG